MAFKSELESSVTDSDYLISRYDSAIKAWNDLRNPAVAVDLYRSPETYLLDTLKLASEQSIDGGSFGKIFKGTLMESYGERFVLNRGPELSVNAKRQSSSSAQQLKHDEKLIPVAVKKLIDTPGEGKLDDQVVEVLREACNVRVLRGTRNVVHVYGVTRNSELNGVCIVMELVDGPHGDLNTFLRTQHDPALVLGVMELQSWWKTKLEIFMEVVVGVKTCHRNGVYHGDLKGKNVVLDAFCTPKLVDFGISFRTRDVEYLNSLGGSRFWMAPEILDALSEPDPDVLNDPFPSDVYSLGMLWIEMCWDGFIPDNRDYFEDIIDNKYVSSGCPVELEVPPGLKQPWFEQVFKELLAMVDGCCQLNRDSEHRFSLEQCLKQAHSAYEMLWDVVGRNNNIDIAFVSSPEYRDMVIHLRKRFPYVLDAFVEQPSKNMVVDIDGNTLLQLFCEIDFRTGVEYIMDRAGITWSFNAERDVPILCSFCVRPGSPAVLRYLASKWRDIVVQEEWLLHEACDGQSEEVLTYLLYELGMDYDTWHPSSNLKPMQRMAHQGNIKLMRILLDHAREPDYVNVALVDKFNTPLSYAIEGDKVEAVLWLLERGGTLGTTGANEPNFVRDLFYHAMNFWSLAVMTTFLELDVYATSNDSSTTKVAELFRHRDRAHIQPQHRAFLPVLKSFVEACRRCGVEPFSHACSRDGDRSVFQLMMSHWKDPARRELVEDRLWRSLGANGNREMVELAISVLGFDGWSFSCLARAARHNAEVLAFLTDMGKLPHNSDDDERKDENSDYQTGELTKAIEEGDTKLVFDRLHSLVEYEEDYTDLIASLDLNLVVSTEGGVVEKLRKLIHELSTKEEWKDPDLQFGQALLDDCVFHGETTMVELLLKEGGVALDGLEVHDHVSTPLLQAVASQNSEMVELLLKAGARPNAGSSGETAMDIAVRCGNRKIVRLLVNYNFDMGMRDKNNAAYIDRVVYMASRKWKKRGISSIEDQTGLDEEDDMIMSS